MSSQLPGLWEVAKDLRENYDYVDLTHSFFPGQPHFFALPDEERKTVFTVAETGFFVERYSIVGQWGTHVDPPVHFVEGARTLDEIDIKEHILPLAVLDLHKEVEANPDLKVSVEHILAWEERNGRIPEGSFVAFRSDWSDRWESDTLNNLDAEGKRHSPGWTIEALKFLHEERGVTAIGHETTDTDPGSSIDAGNFECELYWLAQDRWQIEILNNLKAVPETGALISATWPKPKGGSGFPARVFAIVPKK